jgi:3-hydroxyphenylacetate 6-hydroxylase
VCIETSYATPTSASIECIFESFKRGRVPRNEMIVNVLPAVSHYAQTHPLQAWLFVLFGTPLVYLLVNEYVRRVRRLKGFDGPYNWPLVGNIPDLKYNAAETYRQWSKVYGDVYQIQLGNEPIIVVNSAESARNIFGANSQALSSRPVFWTFHKVRPLKSIEI